MEDEALDAALQAAFKLPPSWYRAHPGQQVRAVRERLGLSQRCLADDSGVSQSVISRLERGGDVHFSTVIRLFEAMGCVAALALLMGCEEAQDLAAESMADRKERQLAGLAVRWEMRYR